MVSPIPNWRRDTPYPDNGSAESGPVGAGWGNGLPGFAQRPHKDIGETGIDPEVHGMASANNMVSPIPNWRRDTPYPDNGSAESGPVGAGWGDGLPGLAQRNHVKKDIGRDEVRPDVYTVVWNLVDPAALPRTKHAPLEFDHPWDEVDHILKMREIAAMNYVDREDAAIKYLREQIETAEANALAKEEDRNPAAFMDFDDADKAREAHLPAKDEKKAEEPKKDEKKEEAPKKDDAALAKKTETTEPAKKEEKAAAPANATKAEEPKKDEKKEEKAAAPANVTKAEEPKKAEAPKEAPKSDAALAKKVEAPAKKEETATPAKKEEKVEAKTEQPAKKEENAAPAKKEEKTEPVKAAAQTPVKKEDAPKQAEAPKAAAPAKQSDAPK